MGPLTAQLLTLQSDAERNQSMQRSHLHERKGVLEPYLLPCARNRHYFARYPLKSYNAWPAQGSNNSTEITRERPGQRPSMRLSVRANLK